MRERNPCQAEDPGPVSCPWCTVSTWRLHTCGRAQGCAQCQQLRPTHHLFASHSCKCTVIVYNNITLTFLISMKMLIQNFGIFTIIRNKLLSPPLKPDLGTSRAEFRDCGAENSSFTRRQQMGAGEEGHRLRISKPESVSKAIDANCPSDA